MNSARKRKCVRCGKPRVCPCYVYCKTHKNLYATSLCQCELRAIEEKKRQEALLEERKRAKVELNKAESVLDGMNTLTEIQIENALRVEELNKTKLEQEMQLQILRESHERALAAEKKRLRQSIIEVKAKAEEELERVKKVEHDVVGVTIGAILKHQQGITNLKAVRELEESKQELEEKLTDQQQMIRSLQSQIYSLQQARERERLKRISVSGGVKSSPRKPVTKPTTKPRKKYGSVKSKIDTGRK